MWWRGFKLMGTWYSAHIMTDSAFAKSRYFCKPQKRSILLDDPDRVSHKYAKLQSSTRMPIEQAWGMVLNRWRIFKKINELRSRTRHLQAFQKTMTQGKSIR